MAFRCAKNANKVIINIGNDEGQSGNYPQGSGEENRMGVWCDWTMEEIPAFVAVEGAERTANYFQENEDGDGIEIRSDEQVLEHPNG